MSRAPRSSPCLSSNQQQRSCSVDGNTSSAQHTQSAFCHLRTPLLPPTLGQDEDHPSIGSNCANLAFKRWTLAFASWSWSCRHWDFLPYPGQIGFGVGDPPVRNGISSELPLEAPRQPPIVSWHVPKTSCSGRSDPPLEELPACILAFFRAASRTFFSSRSSGPNSQSPPATCSLVSMQLRGTSSGFQRRSGSTGGALTRGTAPETLAADELCPTVTFLVGGQRALQPPDGAPSPAHHENGTSYKNAKETLHLTIHANTCTLLCFALLHCNSTLIGFIHFTGTVFYFRFMFEKGEKHHTKQEERRQTAEEEEETAPRRAEGKQHHTRRRTAAAAPKRKRRKAILAQGHFCSNVVLLVRSTSLGLVSFWIWWFTCARHGPLIHVAATQKPAFGRSPG